MVSDLEARRFGKGSKHPGHLTGLGEFHHWLSPYGCAQRGWADEVLVYRNNCESVIPKSWINDPDG
jgi:hypothetical protein